MSGALLLKGDRMDNKQSNQMIGFAVVAIVAYYVLQMIVPFLIWGAIGLVSWRVYLEFNKRK
jgi:hypothetical protein